MEFASLSPMSRDAPSITLTTPAKSANTATNSPRDNVCPNQTIKGTAVPRMEAMELASNAVQVYTPLTLTAPATKSLAAS